MNPQIPAEGILLRRDYGDAKSYRIDCECGDEQHTHHVWIEADDSGVVVKAFVTETTNYWSESVAKRYDIDNETFQQYDWVWKDFINGLVRRLKLTWSVWIKGRVEYESTLCMSKQQALNYAAVLNKSVSDVEEFRKILSES